jgi:polar amino acid transport system permease protein
MEGFDWGFALEILPLLLEAARITVFATVIGFAVAVVLGLVLAILRMSRRWFISVPVGALIEFVRSTPLLIQIYFAFYVLPEFGIVLPAMVAGIAGLALHYSAYTAEVYRAGLQGIRRGQWEAAVALNLGPWTTYRDVVLPQAIPPVVPALGNYLIAMFKDTPLLSAIAVVELMQRAKIIGSDTFRYLEPITLVGVFFLVMSLASSALVRRVERRLALRKG